MKRILTAAFTVLASSAFALTETIDGVTWTYQSGKLGQPDYRSKGERPAPAHEGILPPVLILPQVGALGVAAIQIPNDSDVQRIIVPETVTQMPYESAILGQYSTTDSDGGGKYEYRVSGANYV